MLQHVRWAIVALFFTASTAAAQTEDSHFQLERLRPAMGAEGVIDVNSGYVPGHEMWDISIWRSFSSDPFVLRPLVGGERGRRGAPVRDRVTGNVTASLALWNWLQVTLDLPIILAQTRGKQAIALYGVGELESWNVGDLRLQTKVKLLNQEDHYFNVALTPAIKIPTGSKDRGYFGEAKVAVEPELAISQGWDHFRYALNIGYRWRDNEITTFGLTFKEELYAKLGFGYRFEVPLGINAAVRVHTPQDDIFGDPQLTGLEALGSVDVYANPVTLFAGGGYGILQAVGTPDYRIFFGIRISARDNDADNDGIPDNKDACKDAPEDMDSFEDSDGCPEDDNDQDGVPDSMDKAPNDAEDKDGFEDEDGAPDLDNDGDGIADVDDRCPNRPENINKVEDEDGCPDDIPDTDADGVDDQLDKCPNDAEDMDGFEDKDGCPDLDNDEDGVVDGKDECPGEIGPIENYGCPDKDGDGDGVVDRLDNCPEEAGTPENQGCKAKQLVEIKAEKLEIKDKVYFASGSAMLLKKSVPLLDNIVQVLIAQKRIKKVVIEGHTDSAGSASSNKTLSAERAQAVKDYLVKGGVEAERLESVGYGEERPIDSNETKEGRANNRRVEFVIPQ